MITASQSAPPLSHDLQAVIGLAIVDEEFLELLLAHPRTAVASFELSHADRQAAGAIRGATSLAEYAVMLEQQLANGHPRRVAVRRQSGAPHRRIRAAS